MSKMKGITLYPALMAALMLPLQWDHDQVHGMVIPKMATQVPTVVQNTLTHLERTY
jgi:hypothetical protein